MLLCFACSAFRAQHLDVTNNQELEEYCQKSYGVGAVFDEKRARCVCGPGLVFDGAKCISSSSLESTTNLPANRSDLGASNLLDPFASIVALPTGHLVEWNDEDIEADFRAMDANRDRRITLDEVFNRVERRDAGQPIEHMMETARALHADMDIDKDQAVLLDEYLDYRWELEPGIKDARVHSSRRLNVPVPYDPEPRPLDEEDDGGFAWSRGRRPAEPEPSCGPVPPEARIRLSA